MTSNSKETARQVFERLIAEHPDRFVEAPKTGEGFVILGARPPTPKERSDEEKDAVEGHGR